MKTAMNEVLDLVEQMFANAKTKEVESAMNDIINIITQQGLEKEKEQIIDAYYGGVKLLSGDIETAAKHYYYQTYNQNK